MTKVELIQICDRKNAINAELLAALEEAVAVIKQWHNMDGSANVWPLYLNNAPEMRTIRAAILKARGAA